MENGAVQVRARADCQWSIHADSPWITVLSAARGSGNGVVQYQVTPTGLRTSRKGKLVVGGREFLVEQEGLSAAPVALSVSPDRGAGYDQAFTLRYADEAGADAILRAEVDFHEQTAGRVRDCAVFVNLNDGRVQLQYSPEGGPGLRVSGTLGTLSRLDNSVCSVDFSAVAIERHGKELELRLPMTFKPSFEGPKEIRSRAWDRIESTSPETHVGGRWTVGPTKEAQ